MSFFLRLAVVALCTLQLLACCACNDEASINAPVIGDDGSVDARTPPNTGDGGASDADVVRPPSNANHGDGDGDGDARVPIDARAPDDGQVPDGNDLMDAQTPIDASEPDARIPDPSECTPWTAHVEPDNVICEQEPPPDDGPFGLQVALTFDDGPNPVTTPQILAILRAENIPATFFMVGQRLQTEQNRAIAREIHLDPLFRVANHTFTHARLPDLASEMVAQQIDQTSAAIRVALQDPCYFPRFMRFPYSDSDCVTMDIVRERGFAVAGLHIDSMDWCYANASDPGYCPAALEPTVPEEFREDMIGYVISQLDEYDGGIVLLHDIHMNTAANLQALIDALRAEDVVFVALDDLSIFPVLNAQLEVPTPPACCGGVTR